MLEQQMKKLKFWAVAAFLKYKRAAFQLLFLYSKVNLL